MGCTTTQAWTWDELRMTMDVGMMQRVEAGEGADEGVGVVVTLSVPDYR